MYHIQNIKHIYLVPFLATSTQLVYEKLKCCSPNMFGLFVLYTNKQILSLAQFLEFDHPWISFTIPCLYYIFIFIFTYDLHSSCVSVFFLFKYDQFSLDLLETTIKNFQKKPGPCCTGF